MAMPSKKNPEKLFEQLSKLKGSRASLKSLRDLVAAAGLQQDRALMPRSLRLMHKVTDVLKQALPNLDTELIGGFAANLLDLWETGQELDRELNKLAKLRSHHDRERLRDALIWIDAIQVDMGSYWIGEVQKVLPKLLEGLDRQERKQRRVPRAPKK